MTSTRVHTLRFGPGRLDTSLGSFRVLPYIVKLEILKRFLLNFTSRALSVPVSNPHPAFLAYDHQFIDVGQFIHPSIHHLFPSILYILQDRNILLPPKYLFETFASPALLEKINTNTHQRRTATVELLK